MTSLLPDSIAPEALSGPWARADLDAILSSPCKTAILAIQCTIGILSGQNEVLLATASDAAPKHEAAQCELAQVDLKATMHAQQRQHRQQYKLSPAIA